MTPPNSPDARFEPRASREMACMFDDVSGRYDLINALMTLGQDGAWRAELAHQVPERARVVLDLCTGNGVSLRGLARPGRLVLGVDVSLGMLERAAEHLPGSGWAPRLACADAFQLPLEDGAVDAITIAFGIRNLRPRASALAELRRVLTPGGTLAVLEACAPRPGWFAPFHRMHLEHAVPALGRLSRDPSAYRYLRDSILEFGDGRAFEADLAAAGFRLTSDRAFLLGATRLWVASAPGEPAALHDARPGVPGRGDLPHADRSLEREWKIWQGTQLAISAALTLGLAAGLFRYAESAKNLPLVGWQRWGLWVLLIGALAVFGVRTVHLALRRGRPRRPR